MFALVCNLWLCFLYCYYKVVWVCDLVGLVFWDWWLVVVVFVVVVWLCLCCWFGFVSVVGLFCMCCWFVGGWIGW